jgi:hypothetical protein
MFSRIMEEFGMARQQNCWIIINVTKYQNPHLNYIAIYVRRNLTTYMYMSSYNFTSRNINYLKKILVGQFRVEIKPH